MIGLKCSCMCIEAHLLDQGRQLHGRRIVADCLIEVHQAAGVEGSLHGALLGQGLHMQPAGRLNNN